MYSFQQYLTHW